MASGYKQLSSSAYSVCVCVWFETDILQRLFCFQTLFKCVSVILMSRQITYTSVCIFLKCAACNPSTMPECNANKKWCQLCI